MLRNRKSRQKRTAKTQIERSPRISKKILSRKQKRGKMTIITRKTIITAEVPRLKKESFPLRRVSSSWIADLGYDAKTKVVTMALISNHIYAFYDVPFTVWEMWYYAHSKGTFFNSVIRDKYQFKRLR